VRSDRRGRTRQPQRHRVRPASGVEGSEACAGVCLPIPRRSSAACQQPGAGGTCDYCVSRRIAAERISAAS
jgi:hypothetical protein